MLRLKSFMSATAVMCLLASQASADSKRKAPFKAPRRRLQSTSCDNFVGIWTGFEGSTPLYDSYQLEWRGGEYPAGSFTAVYVSAPSWSLGIGQMAPDNATATIVFDNGYQLNGTVSDGCTTIQWDNDSAWRRTVAQPKKVHMISMNHLDVGYNGIPTTGLVNNILNIYFGLYFPRAVAIANALRARNGTERFVYTTHSWLVDLYLNCPANFTLSDVTLNCPSAADVYAFRQGINQGDITFHAAPFNIQYGGVFNEAMMDAILQQPKRIADQAGVPHPIVASLRDVPGAPRSIIPSLVRNGVPALSIGVNDYAPRPQIDTPCIWTDPDTNASIVLVMTEQGQGYPDNVGPDPTNPGGLGAPYCVSSNFSAAVLCFAFRTDNSGPPESVAEVLNQFDIARWQWPGATVVASTFDAWWSEFQDAVPHLPVSTQEMGETWLTGFAADAPKNSFYRTAAREYASCVQSGACDTTGADTRITNFTRMLMKMPEHTWGLPSIYDDSNYTNAQFHAARAAGMSTYVNSENSWNEQRVFGTQYAMEALQDHPLRQQIANAAAQLTPALPVLNGYSPVTNPGISAFAISLPGGGSVSFGLDSASGSVSSLVVNGTIVLADATHFLGELVYQTVNDTLLDTQHITLPDGHSCCCCYGWGSMQKVADPQQSRTTASLVAVWSSQPGPSMTAPASFIVEVSLPVALNTFYGAPSTVWFNYTVNIDASVSIDVQVFNKTATRLGEAIYLQFATPMVAGSAWVADVLSHWVDPLDVVERGSQHQHGVGDGVLYVNSATGAGVAIDTIDAPVFSPWTAVNEPTTVIVPLEPLTGPVEGFAAVLFSNIYNTNFPLYSVDDAWRQRFTIRPLLPSQEAAERLVRVMKK